MQKYFKKLTFIAFSLFLLVLIQPIIIQTMQPNSETFIIDTLSFDPFLLPCFLKSKFAIQPVQVYKSKELLFGNPIEIHITKWGKYSSYGSGTTNLGFTRTSKCSNHVQMDWERGTSGFATLKYYRDGREITIGTIEISAYADTPKLSIYSDNYHRILSDFASKIIVDNTSDNIRLLLRFEPGVLQLSGVNESEKIQNYSYPMFISHDEGNKWEFDVSPHPFF